MAYQETPIDRAHSVAHYLHAISDLLVTATEGATDMHMVNPNHLAPLIEHICRELDEALDGLDRQVSKPKLRSI